LQAAWEVVSIMEQKANRLLRRAVEMAQSLPELRALKPRLRARGDGSMTR
jgi:hypothetical protein